MTPPSLSLTLPLFSLPPLPPPSPPNYPQVMFEEYDFAGVYIAIQAVLTLYAQGRLIDTHILLRTAPLALVCVAKSATKGR